MTEPRFVARPGAAPQSGADRIERFRAWIEEYATALETGDFGALDRLFAIEATYRPGPFSAMLRGRARSAATSSRCCQTGRRSP